VSGPELRVVVLGGPPSPAEPGGTNEPTAPLRPPSGRSLSFAPNDGGRAAVEAWRVSTAWKKACRRVKDRDGHRCRVCGTPEGFRRSATGRRMSNLVVGHRIPPERYGGSPIDDGNLYTLCRPCNASQGNRTEDEWRAARTGRLVELGIVAGEPGRTSSSVITTGYSRPDDAPRSAVVTGDYSRRVDT